MSVDFRPCAVIPVFNHAASVARVVRETTARLEPVLVVDDGSTDGSGEAAAAAGAELLRHPMNRGKGAALLTAMRAAQERGFTHVVTIDADGQHHAADIPALLAEARAYPDGIVIGRRRMSDSGAPTANRIGRQISNFWVALEGLTWVADAQCGFRVYPIEAVLALPLRSQAYDFEIEVLVRAARRGLPMRNVPVAVEYKTPEGRVTHFDPWRDNLRLSKLNAGLSFSLIPALPGILRSRLARRDRETPPRSFTDLALETGFLMTRLFGVERARLLVLAPTVSFFFLRSPALQRTLLAYAARQQPGAGLPSRLALAWRVLFRFSESLLERMMRTQGFWAREWNREHGEAGVQKIRDALATGRGAVLVTAHVGRWAEAAEILIRAGLDPVLVMDRSEADAFTRTQERVRQPVPRIEDASAGAAAGIRLLRRLRRGELAAIMGDRLAGDPGVEVRLLGGAIRIPLGPFLLAATAGVPWFAVGGFADPDGRIRTLVEGPFLVEAGRGKRRGAAAGEAARFSALLESWIARYPDQWFNFDDPWQAAADATAKRPARSQPANRD